MATQRNNRNDGNTWPKAASTAFAVGDFIIPNGAGAVVPATGGTGDVIGISNELIQSTDADYAVIRPINVSEGYVMNKEFTVTVTAGGPATAAAVGQTIDVDAADASGVDYGSLGAGLDFIISGFIDADTLKVKILS